jgi:hypothetical protein
MSTTLLRDRVRHALDNLIADKKHELVNIDAPPETLNKTRGYIQGLMAANEILTNEYREMNG